MRLSQLGMNNIFYHMVKRIPKCEVSHTCTVTMTYAVSLFFMTLLMRNRSLKVSLYEILVLSPYRTFKMLYIFVVQNQNGGLCFKREVE